jgi:NAD(P)-dependent dehydrogenase (short-subunit alcohol dehydrogenase family)
VTGGNTGIGYGMAAALAQAGARVCIWGTNEERNAAALASLRTISPEAMALRCDVGDESAVDSAMASVLSHFGRLDACFANAGVMGLAVPQPFVDMPAEEWRRVTRVNLDGAFYTLRAAARHMIGAKRGGSLVATSSIAARSGPPRYEHYAATKGALVSMVQALAVELGRHGIRANALLPGWIESSMTDALLHSEGFTAKVLPRVPLRRWGKPEDLGGIAVYFASDVSAYHTGDAVVIDGGYTKF